MSLAKTSLALTWFASAAIASSAYAVALDPALGPTWSEAGQAGAASTARLLGTVTAINGNTISLKSDAGVVATIAVNDTTRIVRTAPGQKDLTGATQIHVQDLEIGDRVLVRATPGSADNTYTAQAVIAMKQGDIAQKQQHEQEDWQKRGVGGIVQSVDAAGSSVVIATAAKTYTIHTTSSTIIRKYAPDSVKFDDAKVSTLDQIKPGDQLRARGTRNADGTEVAADEIVAGAFRNIAGTVVSVDASKQTATVIDLATKKPVVVRFTPDSQLHKLAPEMAQMIAVRLKDAAGGPPGQGGRQGGQGAQRPAASTDNGPGGNDGQGGGPRSGDLSQMLLRSPGIHLADLHKDDAVMIVSSAGAADTATAITLLAGVEPMLQASTKASQSLFSSSWSLGSGGDAASAAQ